MSNKIKMLPRQSSVGMGFVSPQGMIVMDDDEYQKQLNEHDRRIQILENRLEMVLNLLSGTNIQGIETKIKEIEE